MRYFAAASALVVSLTVSTAASAGDEVYLSPGFVGGGLTNSDRGGAVIGGEVSVVWTEEYYVPWTWRGVYMDGVFDARASQGRFSAGGELGVGPFGTDAGAVVSTDGQIGVCVRALFGVGYAFGYVRGTFMPDAVGGPLAEVGLLVKAPFFEPPWRWREYGVRKER